MFVAKFSHAWQFSAAMQTSKRGRIKDCQMWQPNIPAGHSRVSFFSGLSTTHSTPHSSHSVAHSTFHFSVHSSTHSTAILMLIEFYSIGY